MPFELRGNCVHKIGDDTPIKCHDTQELATSHLIALQANVEDVLEKLDESRESIRSYQESALAPIEDDTPMTGNTWEVTIIGANSPEDIITSDDGQKFLKSKNNRYYNLAGLEDSVSKGLWDGIQVFDNHLTDDEFKAKQGMRSADSELLGAIIDPFWDAETSSIKGTQKIIKNDLSQKLLNAHDADILDIFGLSIDTKPIAGENIMIGNESMPTIAGFKEVISIDLVSKPAAGGKFNRVLAAENKDNNRGDIVELGDEVKDFIAKTVIDGIVAERTEREEKEEAKLARKKEKEKEAEEVEENQKDGEDEAISTVPLEEFQVLECKMMLAKELEESKLLDAGKSIVRQAFGDRIFEADDLAAMIKTVKDTEIANDPSGRVTESGTGREVIKVGANEYEQAQQALMQIVMGKNDFKALEHNQDVVVQERIPESYKLWLKSGKQNLSTRGISNWLYDLVGGNPLTDERAYEAVTTTSMGSIVKNAVNLMIANDYSKREQWWETIVRTEEVDTIDQATLIRLYGLSTLDVVEEGNAYTELNWADEEETPTFVKRGNFVGVTLEAMLLDKVAAIRTLPSRLANSWFNSISLRVAAVFTNNSDTGPVLSDTGALFNATAATSAGGHANLLTAALSIDAFDAAYTAMTKQTDQVLGAGAQLGMEAAPKYLLVPTDLRAAALQIRNSEQLPGSANNDINPHFQNFEVIVVPRWTDTNNWACVADPNVTPGLWLIFLTGNTVPSIFTADNDTTGAMFTNDQLRWKVRQMTYRFSATYDNAPVSDFRGLHKNNVA